MNSYFANINIIFNVETGLIVQSCSDIIGRLRISRDYPYQNNLAAHLARAADDVGSTFAAPLTAFKAKEAANEPQEAILASTSTAQTG